MHAHAEYSETLEKVSVSTTLAQSRQVSISTTPKFLVSGSLGLDNSKIPGLKESRYRQQMSSKSQLPSNTEKENQREIQSRRLDLLDLYVCSLGCISAHDIYSF